MLKESLPGAVLKGLDADLATSRAIVDEAAAGALTNADEEPVSETSPEDPQQEIIADRARIADIAERIAKSGRFAMDLEFVSADRYIPELALVQLAWEEGETQHMALVETIETDLGPIFEQVSSPKVLLIAHGAKQDLSLLATRYGVRAQAFVDTQIAAAFAGIAEQIGYANLVQQLLEHRLDKGSQFTDWLRRPLSGKQLRYALDDVRYLLPLWDQMQTRLAKEGRLPWAKEESMALAAIAAERKSPEDAYKSIGGGQSLKGGALGSLRELAAWREELAVEDNIPPSWIIPDGPAVEACRRNAKNERDLKKLRGMPPNAVRKFGDAILDAIAVGRGQPVEASAMRDGLSPEVQAQAQVVTAMVAAKGMQIGIPAKSIAAKADAEALVRHAIGQEVSCRLLEGWRAEVIGSDALKWLRGEARVVADTKWGLRIELADA